MHARTLSILAVLVALLVPALGHADGYTPPNDPDFAGQWNFMGPTEGIDSSTYPIARDPDNTMGIDFTGAWRQGNVGRPDVLVAYIEGGVNYDSNNIKDALDNIFLNKKELPKPEAADGSTYDSYDANGDGHFDLRDYIHDPRVNPACPDGTEPFAAIDVEGTSRSCVPGGQHEYLNKVDIGGKKTAYLSPEDLIVVFSNHVDEDGNGYVDDISGWNFDRNTNDPQYEDTTYGHAPGLISDIAGVANNHYGGVGECRECSVVPIKQGSECLGRPDHWGAAILYATDLGATTISSVVVSYAYSSFNQRAIDYAYNHGVVLSLDSNDFDAMDHTDGMLFNHVLVGNSLAKDSDRLAGADQITTWFRARSSVTSYGTHNIFSGYGTSTSGATPFMASMAAMVQSAGLNAADKGTIPSPLEPDEVKQVMMNASSAVIPQTQSPYTPHQWPGNPLSATDATHTNWSTQYGYGRPDIGKATQMVMEGKLPPTAEITSPKWFKYVDPVADPALAVDGALAPSRIHSQGVHWVLEAAAGADPADAAFFTVASGDQAMHGRLGTVDLTKIQSLYASKPALQTLQPDGAEQYTVSIRLRVWDGNGLKAEDRRSIGLRHDPSLVGGKPRHIGGAELSGAASYADLEGRHEQDLIFSTYDGDVHALRPNGHEVKGFPVHSSMIRSFDPTAPMSFHARAYETHPEFRDLRDPLSGTAVGDMNGNGELDIVATGMNGRVYAWDARGHALPGFPADMDQVADQHDIPTPRAPTPNSKTPLKGAWAQPVLAPLEGDGKLDVIIGGWDRKVYAWRPDGTRVPGWPVTIALPEADFASMGIDPKTYIRDPKLMYAVGVADVLGKGRPQVFVSAFDCSKKSAATQDTVLGLTPIGSNPASKAFLYGVWPDGNDHEGGAYLPNWPVALPALSFCYDESIDFVGNGVAPPTFADVDGSGLKVMSGAVTGPMELLNGDGSVFKKMDMACTSAQCSANPPYRPGDTHTLTLTGQGGFGDILGAGKPSFVQSTTGVESILAALGSAGESLLPQVYEKAWDPTTGQVASPAFPVRQDGFPFYDAPLVADLGTGGPTRAAIETNDNYYVHAWGPTGAEAPGFPKYTGQWNGFAGTVGEPRMDGVQHLVFGTREGDLFDWKIGGDGSRNDQWWHGRHDERNTGQYGLDTRRPAAVTDLEAHRAENGAVVVQFRATGDDAQYGTAKSYDVRWSAEQLDADKFLSAGTASSVPEPGASGSDEHFSVSDVPVQAHWLTVEAVDDAGNRSAPVSVPID